MTIDRATNGWMLTAADGFTEVVQEHGTPEEAAAEMLRVVAEYLGPFGGRHSAQRVRIVIEPGDKHHDYHPQPCSDCECRCDPDVS
jgi:hypothetical protein